MTGKSACSNIESLNLNVIWSAIIENDKVSEWQVFEDNIENRKQLKIPWGNIKQRRGRSVIDLSAIS